MNKKQVLLFGDSNTWGFDVKTYLQTKNSMSRLDEDARYGGLLRKRLASWCNIIEEGLPGRTTVLSGPIVSYNSGKYYLLPCLLSHAPLDLVVLLLGTNDMQSCYELPPVYSGAGIGELIEIIKYSGCGRGKTPEILVVSPIEFGANLKDSEYATLFNVKKIFKRMKLISVEYEKITKQKCCHFMNGANHASAGDEDSVHLDKKNHEKLALALEQKISEIVK